MQRYNSITLHVSPKNEISVMKRTKNHKTQILPQTFFLSNLGIKRLNLLVFERLSWKFSSNWYFQRNVGFNLERAQTAEHCNYANCIIFELFHILIFLKFCYNFSLWVVTISFLVYHNFLFHRNFLCHFLCDKSCLMTKCVFFAKRKTMWEKFPVDICLR